MHHKPPSAQHVKVPLFIFFFFESISTVYIPLPNISKNSATHQKKIESAIRIPQNTTGVPILQAMILAGFSKADVANEIVRQAVRRHHQQKQSNVHVGRPRGHAGQSRGCWPESWGEHNHSNIFFLSLVNLLSIFLPFHCRRQRDNLPRLLLTSSSSSTHL